jgi:alanine dehydrogenase
MAIFLTEEDVHHLLPMAEAIEAVEQGFKEHGSGTAVNLHRSRVQAGDTGITMMVAALGDKKVAGFKVMGAGGAQVHLYDGEKNQLVAVLEARNLGQIRTGAASAVAARYMSRPDAATVGLVGTGRQAETQLEGICAVRPIKQALAYSRTPEHLEAFCVKMSQALGIQVTAAVSPKEAVQESDIAVAITNVRTLEPVLLGEWVAPGTHLVGAGANSIGRRELDDEAVARCSVIVTDARDQAKLECADLALPIEKGLWDWDKVWELGQVVIGQIQGRTSADDITLYESQGIALEDIAVATHIYQRAMAEGIGKTLPF